jgi:predicted transcriptional regulator
MAKLSPARSGRASKGATPKRSAKSSDIAPYDAVAMSVRLPLDLHATLQQVARKHRRSINSLLIELARKGLQKDPYYVDEDHETDDPDEADEEVQGKGRQSTATLRKKHRRPMS